MEASPNQSLTLKPESYWRLGFTRPVIDKRNDAKLHSPSRPDMVSGKIDGGRLVAKLLDRFLAEEKRSQNFAAKI